MSPVVLTLPAASASASLTRPMRVINRSIRSRCCRQYFGYRSYWVWKVGIGLVLVWNIGFGFSSWLAKKRGCNEYFRTITDTLAYLLTVSAIVDSFFQRKLVQWRPILFTFQQLPSHLLDLLPVVDQLPHIGLSDMSVLTQSSYPQQYFRCNRQVSGQHNSQSACRVGPTSSPPPLWALDLCPTSLHFQHLNGTSSTASDLPVKLRLPNRPWVCAGFPALVSFTVAKPTPVTALVRESFWRRSERGLFGFAPSPPSLAAQIWAQGWHQQWLIATYLVYSGRVC